MSTISSSAGRSRRLVALLAKESLQIIRDPSSILIAFVLPLILLFLFGYGVSLDANRVRLGIAVEEGSEAAGELIAAFEGSRFFEVTLANDRRALEGELVSGRLRGILVIPQDFTRQVHSGGAAPQLLTDGSEPNTASLIEGYVRSVVEQWRAQGRGAAEPAITVAPRMRFNPELKSRYFLVPGSITIVMTLIGTLLTALVVAREWERGTMEAMMATPIGVAELLIGKLVPYFVLALFSMGLCTALAVTLFGVPMRGSVLALFALASAFLVPALGQGLLISALTRSQFVASQAALLSGFLPAFLLSGFIFEIASMPTVIQWVTVIIPARYFIPSLQTVFLAGDIWPLFARDITAMLALGVVLVGLAIRVTKKRLD